jgi:hypothetical protein
MYSHPCSTHHSHLSRLSYLPKELFLQRAFMTTAGGYRSLLLYRYMMYLVYHALGDVTAFICSMVQGAILFNHFFHMY